LTIMLSSHLLSEVERICNRVAIISKGRMVYQGTIEKLISCEQVIKITVEPLEKAYRLLNLDPSLSISRNGSNSLYIKMRAENVARLNALLVANEIKVMELSPQRATLEDVFLTLTGSELMRSRVRRI